MRHFKFLLINIVAFSFLFFVISLLFPGQVVTSKSILLGATKEKVAEKLNNTAGWKQWNVFDSDNTITANAGNTGDSLIFSFENDSHNQLQSHFNLYQQQANAITLNWGLVEKLPWYKPWKKFSAMVLNKEIASAMDSSLNKFKTQVEAGK